MLFKNSTILKQYAQLTGTINFDSAKRTIQFVEDQYIIPVLGKELYANLNGTYTEATDDGTGMTDPLIELLDKCRSVVAPMFCYHYAPKADVQLSDSGMKRSESKDMVSAYQEQRTHFREANLREGEAATETLLQFLEDNKGDYEQWVASDSFKSYRSLFIKSGNEFNELFPSQSPYRNFWAMRSKMVDVEESNIRYFLGDDLFEELKDIDQDSAGEFADEQVALIDKLKRAIANFTVAFSIPLLNIRIDANGITVNSNTRTTNDDVSVRNAADDKALLAIMESCNASGQQWLNNAEKYLLKNKDLFANWKGFDKKEEKKCPSINDGNSGLFGLG